jgi:hypothetical protein
VAHWVTYLKLLKQEVVEENQELARVHIAQRLLRVLAQETHGGTKRRGGGGVQELTRVALPALHHRSEPAGHLQHLVQLALHQLHGYALQQCPPGREHRHQLHQYLLLHLFGVHGAKLVDVE